MSVAKVNVLGEDVSSCQQLTASSSRSARHGHHHQHHGQCHHDHHHQHHGQCHHDHHHHHHDHHDHHHCGQHDQHYGASRRSDHDESPLFEVSIEIAQIHLGGINTCLRTRAAKTVGELGDRYIMIGPLTPYAEQEAIEQEDFEPESSLFEAVQEMRARGFRVVTGRWKVPGSPRLVLLGANQQWSKIVHKYRQEVFLEENISLNADDKEAEEALVFSYLTAEYLCQYNAALKSQNAQQCREEGPSRLVAHFHDWKTGLAIAFLRQWKVLPTIATVYTVHSTALGRHLSAVDADLYGRLEEHVHHGLEEQPVVKDFYNYHRHQIELAAVKYAHTLTAVSEIAREEAECLLRRKPDVMTYNGLDLSVGSKPRVHSEDRAKIDQFVRNHFAGEELGETLYVVSAGRSEFHNKGIDILTKSLAHLNHLLRNHPNKMTIVAFLFYPAADCNGVNWDAAQRQKDGDYLDAIVAKIEKKLGRKIYDVNNRRRLPLQADDQLDSLDIERLEEATFLSHQTGIPPVATHHLVNEFNDPILGSLRYHELKNGRHDRVKVIYCPRFDGDHPLMKVRFQDVLSGGDLGVFPGRYSWGYTPALCATYGTPSVVSDSSGYGVFVKDANNKGIFILPLKEAVDDLMAAEKVANFVFDFATLPREQRETQRENAKDLSRRLDWSTLMVNYLDAWNRASGRTSIARLNVPASLPSSVHVHGKDQQVRMRGNMKSIGTNTTEDLRSMENSLNEVIEKRNASSSITPDLDSSILGEGSTTSTNPKASSTVGPSGLPAPTDPDEKKNKKKKRIPKPLKPYFNMCKSICSYARNLFRNYQKEKKPDKSEK